jgi:hypothetical protein
MSTQILCLANHLLRLYSALSSLPTTQQDHSILILPTTTPFIPDCSLNILSTIPQTHFTSNLRMYSSVRLAGALAICFR